MQNLQARSSGILADIRDFSAIGTTVAVGGSSRAAAELHHKFPPSSHYWESEQVSMCVLAQSSSRITLRRCDRLRLANLAMSSAKSGSSQ